MLCSFSLLSACIRVHLRLKILPAVIMARMIPTRFVIVHLASVALTFCLIGCASHPSNQRPTPATAPGDRSAPFDAYQAMADALESEDAAAYRAATYADGQAGRKSIDDLAKS